MGSIAASASLPVTITASSTSEVYGNPINLAEFGADTVAALVSSYVQGSSTAVLIKVQGSWDKVTWDYIPLFNGTDFSVTYNTAVSAAKTIQLYDTTEHNFLSILYPFLRFTFTFSTSHVGASVVLRPIARNLGGN